jgi:hypothetical protein
MVLKRAVTSGQAEAAIRAIRAYYRQGQLCLAETPRSGNYGIGFVDKRCGRLGPSWNPTKLRKARQFADQYSQKDLRSLIRLLRQHHPVFGISHVGILLTVPAARLRTKLQRWCIEGRRSAAELEAEIRKRLGVRRQGGRRRAVSPEVDQVLVQIDMTCDTWRRWHRVIDPEQPPEGKPCILEQLPPKVQDGIRLVNRATKRLAAAVGDELQALRVQHTIGSSV